MICSRSNYIAPWGQIAFGVNRGFGTFFLLLRQIYRKVFIGGLQMKHIWKEDIEARYLSAPAIGSHW